MKNKTAPKNSKGIKIVLILVVFIVIFVLLNKKSAAQDAPIFKLPSISPTSSNSSSTNSTSTSSNTTNNSGPSSNNYTVLSRGMRSDSVRKLQYLLNKYNKAFGKATISVDGVFGSNTLRALQNATGKSALSYNSAYQILEQQLRSRGLDPNKYL